MSWRGRWPHSLLQSCPPQSPPVPDVDIPDDEDDQEDHHLDETEQRKLVEEDRPGEQENGLDVENDEKHRDQVVANRKTMIMREGLGLVAALVRIEIGGGGSRMPEDTRCDEGCGQEEHRDQSEDQNGQVARHVRLDLP